MTKLWFKAKNYGWGWVPVTWQGWVITLAFVAFIVYLSTFLVHGDALGTIIYFSGLIGSASLLIAICLKKGEKPEWRWGRPATSRSQVEPTEGIKALVHGIKTPITPEVLVEIRDLMRSKITERPYDDATSQHEASIRWKRTADEILRDGYVYKGKACTDHAVLFIALCRTLGLEAVFVKVRKEKYIHSVVEVRLGDGWYVFDPSSPTSTPFKGTFTKDSPLQGWHLWKKGRDAWDLGLTDFDSKSKIK